MHMYAYRYLYHKCCPSPAQLPDFKESSFTKHSPTRGGKKSLPSRKSIVIFWTLKKRSKPWLQAVTFWLLLFSFQEPDAAWTSIPGSVTCTWGNVGCLCPPCLAGLAGSERAQQQHTGLQLFNQSLRLHILITYFQAINRRPTAGFPPPPKISLCILIHSGKKQGLWAETASWCHESGIFLQRAKAKKKKKRREAFFRDNITCDVFTYWILISAEL